MFTETVPIVLGVGALSCVNGDNVYIALGLFRVFIETVSTALGIGATSCVRGEGVCVLYYSVGWSVGAPFLLGSQLVLARNFSGRAVRQGSETKLASLDAKWLCTYGDFRLSTGRR